MAEAGTGFLEQLKSCIVWSWTYLWTVWFFVVLFLVYILRVPLKINDNLSAGKAAAAGPAALAPPPPRKVSVTRPAPQQAGARSGARRRAGHAAPRVAGGRVWLPGPADPRRWGRAACSPRDSRSLPGALPGPRPPAPGERGRREPRSSRGRPRVCAKSEGSPSEPGPSRTVRRGRAPAAQPDGWAASPHSGAPGAAARCPAQKPPGAERRRPPGPRSGPPGLAGGGAALTRGEGLPRALLRVGMTCQATKRAVRGRREGRKSGIDHGFN